MKAPNRKKTAAISSTATESGAAQARSKGQRRSSTSSRFERPNSTRKISSGSRNRIRIILSLRGAGARRLGFAAIHPLAQLLARLEIRHRLPRHRNGGAGARGPPGAGIPPLGREGAEAAQFHPVATRQGGGDLVEDGGDDQLDIRLAQMRILGRELRDQLALGHGVRPLERDRVRLPKPYTSPT